MDVQKLRKYIVTNWRGLVIGSGLLSLVGGALFWRLGSLPPGYSQDEVGTFHHANLQQIIDNPLNAPFHLIVKALEYILPNNLITTRLTATIFGLITLAIFGVLLKNWHDSRTAILGTILFGLSAWFLHTARMGTPEVLFFGVFALLAAGFWLKATGSRWALFACFLLSAVLMYVPGMVWFVGLGVLWQWKVIDRIFKQRLGTVTFAGIAWLATLAPLAWAMYRDHNLIKPFLGLPHEWPTPLEMIRNVLEVPYHLFLHGETNPAAWLGNAPILDIFSLVMFVLGGYLYFRHVRLTRTTIFIATLLLTVGLIALGGPVGLSVIIPIIYMVVAAGVAHTFNQWFMVFPRNPIARSIGYGMMVAVVGLVCAFHLTHYFVGWPQAAATHDVYTVQKP